MTVGDQSEHLSRYLISTYIIGPIRDLARNESIVSEYTCLNEPDRLVLVIKKL